MSQSLSAIYIHVTFATKYRNHWINDEISEKLHAYIASILKDLGCLALIINSMPDHIHILFRLSKTVTIAQVIEEIKRSSSKRIKKQLAESSSFYWQRGYGAFSVSSSYLDVVEKYIANQKEHHKRVAYRKEIERFMSKYHVKGYDPDYYWDG